MATIAASPRGPRASVDPTASPPHSPSSTVASTTSTGARDSALMRYVHEKQPFNAAHGTKGAAWEAISRAMFTHMRVSWQGIMCRNRATFLLEKYDRQRASRGVSKFITGLDPDILPILEEQLLLVAKTRVEAQLKAKQKALGTASAVQKAREEKQIDRERQIEAKAKALMKERDEKRAAAVVAAAARARETAAVNTATVVAKRRKRKGVKTKEQKAAASAAMFDALHHSREEYLNQLRVQTAAEAAAEVTGADGGAQQKPAARSSVDLDLNLLRAVAKCSPFSQETKQSTETQWVAVTERLMQYCNLKFTTTALRDRCEALIKDFEANDCKKSTFTSGVVVADEERLGLLRVIRKEHDRQARQSASDMVPREARRVEGNDTAIEIEDEQEEEDDADVSEPHQDDVEQWGSLEENRVEEDVGQADEQAEESFVEDTQDEEEPEPSAQHQDQRVASKKRFPEQDYAMSVALPMSSQASLSHSVRKRRRSEDADPAVGMNIDGLQLDDNSPDWSESQDYTPRKYKHQHQQDLEQEEKTEESERAAAETEERVVAHRHETMASTVDKNSEQLGTFVDLIRAERQERRVEFKNMLDLMKQQTNDHRREWEREHDRRSREQSDRQREMTALVGLLTKERRDRKSETLTMLEAMNKDRDDRREEFKAMMALMTKLAETRSTS